MNDKATPNERLMADLVALVRRQKDAIDVLQDIIDGGAISQATIDEAREVLKAAEPPAA